MTGTHPLTMGESDLALSTTMEPAPQEAHDQSWEPTLVVNLPFEFEMPDYSSTVADLIKFLAEQVAIFIVV